MNAISHGGVTLRVCGACRGLWLEDGEFKRVSGHDLPAFAGAASLELDEVTRTCPRCGFGLSEQRMRDDAALKVDVCRRCQGLFLEHGELQRLKALVAAPRHVSPGDAAAFEAVRSMPGAPAPGTRYKSISTASRRAWREDGSLLRELDGNEGWLALLFNLPVEEEGLPSSIPIGQVLLLGGLIAVWIAQVAVVGLDRSIELYGFVPSEFFEGRRLSAIVTATLVHGSWPHVLGNLYFLFLFGDNVERRIGTAGYYALYLAGGLAASVLTLAATPGDSIPHVGASGAIAAVMGAYLILFPSNRVLQPIFRWFFRVWAIALPAWLYLLGWLALNAMGAWVGVPGTGWWAHIGGFVFGAAVALVLRARRRD